MKSILFFHPKNDYTGSTRVLADVIARDYAGQSVDIIVNRNHGKGFLSELPNVQLIGYCVPTWHGKRIPVVGAIGMAHTFCVAYVMFRLALQYILYQYDHSLLGSSVRTVVWKESNLSYS